MASTLHRKKVAKVTGNYRWAEGAHFNHDYYEDEHAALTWQALQPLGLLRFECDRVVVGGGVEPGAIIATSSAYFSSLDAARAAMAAAGRRLAADLSAYTSIQPELHVSEAWITSSSDA